MLYTLYVALAFNNDALTAIFLFLYLVTSHVESHQIFEIKELDDLMMSLSDFKLKEKEDEPVSTNLDMMLGNLREDMDKQGVRTTQKGICFACQKPIAGQVVTALGRTWHPEVLDLDMPYVFHYLSFMDGFLCLHTENPNLGRIKKYA